MSEQPFTPEQEARIRDAVDERIAQLAHGPGSAREQAQATVRGIARLYGLDAVRSWLDDEERARRHD